VLAHLPRLLGLRRRLRRELLAWQPDAFIGIDAPEFNLGSPGSCGRAPEDGAVFSPQVWAWRERRVHRIAAACDLVLCACCL